MSHLKLLNFLQEAISQVKIENLECLVNLHVNTRDKILLYKIFKNVSLRLYISSVESTKIKAENIMEC